MVCWVRRAMGVRKPGSFVPAATHIVPVGHWAVAKLSDGQFSERFA